MLVLGNDVIASDRMVKKPGLTDLTHLYLTLISQNILGRINRDRRA